MLNKAGLITLAVVALLAAFSNAQSIDLTFCNVDTMVPDPQNLPFPTPTINSQYQAIVEKNEGLPVSATTEIEEYFDGVNNMGVALYTRDNLQGVTYSYFNTNEVLVVLGDKCVAGRLNESMGTGPFFYVMQNGAMHIASAANFAQANIPGLKYVHIGEYVISGINVNQWMTCVYAPHLKATMKVTLSISNPKKWTPAVFIPDQGVPVETKIEYKVDGTNNFFSETHSIKQYRPLITADPDTFVTPAGVFCQGRVNTKALPKMPDSFSFRVEVVSPAESKVTNLREEFDFGLKLFRIDYNTQVEPTMRMTEIHDFNTGIKYTINRYFSTCKISTLDTDAVDAEYDGHFVSMRNSSSFFDFDGVDYQYVGQKRIKDVLTDVWIGQKLFKGMNTTWEWHIMVDQWYIFETMGFRRNVPVLLTVMFDVPYFNNETNSQDILKLPSYYHFNSFDSTRINLFDYDIALCDQELESKEMTFSLPNDKATLARSVLTNFKLGIFLAIESEGVVSPLRISSLDVFFEDDAIHVIFTLFERPSFVGAVNMTVEALTLDQVIKLIRGRISEGSFVVPLLVSETEKYSIIANPNSFHVFDGQRPGFNPRGNSAGYSGGSVAAITIIITLVGLSAGFLVVVLHRLNYIKIIPQAIISRVQ